jgi:hypothetical protein
MIKIEVGQVWKSTEDEYANQPDYEAEVLKVWDGNVAYYHKALDAVNQTSIEEFTSVAKLIKNADGTPIWREIDKWEAMRLLGEAREPIECQVSDNDIEEWTHTELVGVNMLHHLDEWFIGSDKSYEQCRVEVKND